MRASKKIPLVSFHEKARRLEVFELKAKPSFTPIDFNIFALTENLDWSLSDRLRFWYVLAEDERPSDLQGVSNIPPHLTVHRLDKEEDAFCRCIVNIDGEVLIWSNDNDYAEDFFGKLFVNVPPSFHEIKDWEITRGWLDARDVIEMFRGSLDGAIGWANRIPPAISRSVEEAKASYDLKNWNSCVVMCRRALEAIMEFAFQRVFKQDPKGLDFNGIVRRFEKEKPNVMPKHWIGILDSVRTIGNIPGAHPQEVKGYKFTRLDAELALFNTVRFQEAYFSKIVKDTA